MSRIRTHNRRRQRRLESPLQRLRRDLRRVWREAVTKIRLDRSSVSDNV